MAKRSVGWLSGRQLNEVAFPLGGIGTGTISLGGRGQLRDWEIFNSPGKGNDIPAMFALWCKTVGGKPVARVLEGEPAPPFMDRGTFGGGHGLPQWRLLGLPRFRTVRFRGEYPLATLELADPSVPLAVALEAFNPMIPLAEADSGIPAAIFNWTFTNRTARPVAMSLAAAFANPLGYKRGAGGGSTKPGFGSGNTNEFIRAAGLTGIRMSLASAPPGDPAFGTAMLATNAHEPDAQTHWFRGGWFDHAHVFWDDFAADGRVESVTEPATAKDGASDIADLVIPATLAPGESRTFTVVFAWHLPNRVRRDHWWGLPDTDRATLTNWYATRWPDAQAVARYTLDNLDRLTTQTRAYHDTLFASTLPAAILDAVSSQASIVRTTTGLRLADGSFHAFEGCSDAAGCCPMNCTHVWNYAQSAAFLFPALERSVRQTDFLHNTRTSGKTGLMSFRTILPTTGHGCGCGQAGPDPTPQSPTSPTLRADPVRDFDRATGLWDFKPAADGQMGTVVRAYREWRQSGDRDWLAGIWPGVVRALDFAWLGEDGRGLHAWDPGKTGVITGEQQNTYDVEFFGPNPLTSVMYLAALRAGAELAEVMGQPQRADEYRSIAARGRAWVDRHLWGRDYYVHRFEPPTGRAIPDDLRGPDGSAKYQVGSGCLSDQLLGQFLAHVCGLGHLLDARKVRTAMKSIFRHNFRRRVGDHANVQRVYAVGDEGGLLLCTWPNGGRERLPFPYSDEVWTGIEYQVAAGLIYEGLVDEGVAIVQAARARYAGHNRNPFNEVECGHHYARAMSSWALLLAMSGFEYDAASAGLGFAPRVNADDFRVFYSTGSSWGMFQQKVVGHRRVLGKNRGRGRPGSLRPVMLARLDVEFGRQTLRTLSLRSPGRIGVAQAEVIDVNGAGRPVAARIAMNDGRLVVTLESAGAPLELNTGDTLAVRLFSR